jgi:CRISPR-associated protein Csm2
MEILEIKKMLKTLDGFKASELPPDWSFDDPIDEKIIDFTEKLGLFLCDIQIFIDKKGNEEIKSGRDAVTNSQIRNVFGELKRIQMQLIGRETERWSEVKSSFHLIRPKIAYTSGRVLAKNKKSRIREFSTLLDKAVLAVKGDEHNAPQRFMRFVDFFEAILAYHKSFGGKEN